MLPIIYTPVQGDAIQAYSKLFRRPEVHYQIKIVVLTSGMFPQYRRWERD